MRGAQLNVGITTLIFGPGLMFFRIAKTHPSLVAA